MAAKTSWHRYGTIITSLSPYGTRKLLRFEISKMLIAVQEKHFVVSFIIIFGTFSFPVHMVRVT